MPPSRIASLLLALASTLVPACKSETPTGLSTPIIQGTGTPTAFSRELPVFDPGNFVEGVTNPLFPLPLGRRMISRGTEDEQPEVVVTDITRLHKTILGVSVIVVLDRVFLSGELKEKTFDWFAQDKDGNVWYFGEDTKEFENGKVVSTAGSFEAGKNGAKAGIIMLAHPVLGKVTPQEDAPDVAEDRGRPVDLDATATVPFGTFHQCLKQEEFTPLEPGALEEKLYCPGFGIVDERDLSGGSVHTSLTTVIQR